MLYSKQCLHLILAALCVLIRFLVSLKIISAYDIHMKKLIVLIFIALLSLSTAGAATVEIPEGNTDFILNIDYTRYPGSGNHGRYSKPNKPR